MGLMDTISRALGNASEVTAAQATKDYGKLLSEGERIERAYKLIRDGVLITNKRLILVDKQGITGAKISYHSIPFRSITQFSVETAGHLDLDAELVITISGQALPVKLQFNKDLSIYDVQSVLASYILR
jgi:hypothetical protein